MSGLAAGQSPPAGLSSKNSTDGSVVELTDSRPRHSPSSDPDTPLVVTGVLHNSLEESCLQLDLCPDGTSEEDDVDDFRTASCSSIALLGDKQNSSCSRRSRSDSWGGQLAESRDFDHVRIAHCFNPAYDEEVKLDASPAGSSVESPRSEDDSRTHDDVGVAEEGTELSLLSYQETPIRERRHSDDYWDYMPNGKLSYETGEEDGERRQLLGSSRVLSCLSPPQSIASHHGRGDETWHSAGYGATAGGKERTEDSFDALAGHSSSSDRRRESGLRRSSSLKDGENKLDLSDLVDLNGNSRALDAFTSLQMRHLINTTSTSSLASYSPTSLSHSYATFTSESKDLDRKKERRRLKLERQKWTRAEAYEDHKEFQDINDILYFVEGAGTSSKTDNKTVRKKPVRPKGRDLVLNGAVDASITADEDGHQSSSEDLCDLTNAIQLTEVMGTSHSKDIETHPEIIVPSAESNSSQPERISNGLVTEAVVAPSVQHQVDIYCVEVKSGPVDNVVSDKHIITNKDSKSKLKKTKREDSSESFLLFPVASSKEKSVAKLEMRNSVLVSSKAIEEPRHSLNIEEAENTKEIKLEDSFTEVKKRKKRSSVKVPTANHFVSPVNHVHAKSFRVNPRSQLSSLPTFNKIDAFTASSITRNSKPFQHSGQTLVPNDLNLSSFPVLPSHEQIFVPLSNRRNSCGDISADIVDSKVYDSDRESAKSLPYVHGKNTDANKLPVYQISYASKVAAPRRSEIINSNSSESGVASGSQKSSASSMTYTPSSSTDMSSYPPVNRAPVPDRRATVWKGSPRERRHSIGSGPEDKPDKDKVSVVQSSRQCGSQEVLRIETPQAKTCDNSSETSCLILEQDSSILDLQFGDAFPEMKLNTSQEYNCKARKETGFSFKKCSEIIDLNKKNTFSDKMSKENPVSDKTSRENHASEKMTRENQPNGLVSAIPVEISDIIVSPKQKLELSTQIVQTNGSSSTNTSKSVVFMDRRFRNTSFQCHGITFGFDAVDDQLSKSSSQSDSQQPQHPPAHPLVEFDSLTSSTSSSLAGRTSGETISCVNIPVPSHTPAISFDQSISTPLLSYNDNNNKFPPKAQCLQGPCNVIALSPNDKLDPETSASSNVTSVSSCGSSISINSNATTVVPTSLSHSSTKEVSQKQVRYLKTSPGGTGLASHPVNSCSGQANCPVVPATPLQLTDHLPLAACPGNPSMVVFSPHHPPPLIPPEVLLKMSQRNISISSSTTPTSESLVPEKPASTYGSTAKRIEVIYGEKINAVAGFRQLVFLPCSNSPQNVANSQELARFIKNKWTEITKPRIEVSPFKVLDED